MNEALLRTRHLKYFVQLAEQAEIGLRGPEQTTWYLHVNDEHDNLRAALDWAGKTDIEAGLYISGRLGEIWGVLDVHEGIRWLTDFLQQPKSKEYPRARAKALRTQAWLLTWLFQFQQAQVAAEESLALCAVAHDQPGEIDALYELGRIHSLQYEKTEQLRLFEKALALSQSLGDQWREARVLRHLGLRLNDPGYGEKAATLYRELGDQRSLANTLADLGVFNLDNGNIELAQKYIDESELLSQSNKKADIWMLGNSVKSMIAFRQADYKQARALLQERLLVARETGNRVSYLWAQVRLGHIAVRDNHASEARNIFAESAREFQKDKSVIGVAFTLEGLAGLFITVGKSELAARLIGWADATRKQIEDPRPKLEQADVDKIIVACIENMGKALFNEMYEEGKTMTFDEAVAYALEER